MVINNFYKCNKSYTNWMNDEKTIQLPESLFVLCNYHEEKLKRKIGHFFSKETRSKTLYFFLD